MNEKTFVRKINVFLSHYAKWLFFYLAISFAYYLSCCKGVIPSVRGGDSFGQNFPLRLFYADEGARSVFSWIPYQFLGLPFLGILHAGLLYPFNFLCFLMPPLWAFTVNNIVHPALAAFFCFIYARLLGIRTFPAFFSGIVFGFSGFVMAHITHTSMMNAAVWLPLLLFLYEKMRREFNLKYAFWASLVIAIQVFAGHYQIVVYTYLVLGFFAIYYSVWMSWQERRKFLYLCFLPIFLGSIIALPQLIATKELSNFAWRVEKGYSYFTEYSFAPFMLPQLIFPFWFGGGYGGSYYLGAWNLTEMSGFMGTMPLILGLWAGLRLWKEDRNARFLLLIALLAFFWALGGYNPLYRVMYYVPVYNLFRCPARHWLEFNLAVSILFGYGINIILCDRHDQIRIYKKLVLVFVAVIVVAIFNVMFWGSLRSASLIDVNARSILVRSVSIRNPAVVIPFIFLFCYSVLVWVFMWKSAMDQRIKNAIAGILLLIVLFEAFSFGGFHEANFSSENKISQQLKDPVLNFLGAHLNHDRGLFLTEYAIPLYYVPSRIHLINGYDPFMPAALNALLDMQPWGYSDNWLSLVRNNLILSSLSTRYLIVPKKKVNKYNIDKITSGEGVAVCFDVPLSHWEFINVRPLEAGEYSLQSSDGLSVSMLRQRVSLRPNTFYLLRLEARSHRRSPTGILAFDLYGSNYDSKEQELDIDPKELNRNYRVFYRVINTGDNIPTQVDLRVFTFSKEPILVRHIEVKELRDFAPPYIGRKDTFDKQGIPLYERVFESPEWVVYENKNCLPRAFSITHLEVARDIREVRARFETLSVNPAETAFVSREDLDKIGRTHFSRGDVHIDSYDTNRITIKAEFPSDAGFVVLSDQYFPGWKAFVDGQEVPIYQVNGLVRGVVVPKGTHMVEFIYRPVKIYVATVIGLVVCVAVLVALLNLYRSK
ncbi:MAG: YfhO family protein [Thermodesulforhabdaceae bacterium]